jgi:hypothetical protein
MSSEAFRSRRWGHKRETSGHLHPWKTSGSARDFLKKLEKMRRRTATEMAFMGTLKVSASSHQHRLSIFFPETAGQSSRKVSNFFRHARRIYAGFRFGRAQAERPAVVGSFPTTRSRSVEPSRKSGHIKRQDRISISQSFRLA